VASGAEGGVGGGGGGEVSGERWLVAALVPVVVVVAMAVLVSLDINNTVRVIGFFAAILVGKVIQNRIVKSGRRDS
jgi:hypothetical protein